MEQGAASSSDRMSRMAFAPWPRGQKELILSQLSRTTLLDVVDRVQQMRAKNCDSVSKALMVECNAKAM
jgi:hypothetical protein